MRAERGWSLLLLLLFGSFPTTAPSSVLESSPIASARQTTLFSRLRSMVSSCLPVPACQRYRQEEKQHHMPTHKMLMSISSKGWKAIDPNNQKDRRDLAREAMRMAMENVSKSEQEPESNAPEWLKKVCFENSTTCWEKFYRSKTNTFFKDRNVLRAVFPELMPEAVRENPSTHCERVDSHLPPSCSFLYAEASKLLEDKRRSIERSCEFAPMTTRSLEKSVRMIMRGCQTHNISLPELFVSLDLNKDGRLSVGELEEIFCVCGSKIPVDEKLSFRLLLMFDRDKDGLIDMKEWMAGFLQHFSSFLDFPSMLGLHLGTCSFQENMKEKTIVCEIGCGVGNSVWPLLRANREIFVMAFDSSPSAISLMRANSEYIPTRVCAWVEDITSNDSQSSLLPPESADFATLVFVLSAVPPDKTELVLRRAYDMLKIGGKLLLRDYAQGDLAHLRHGEAAYLQSHCYARGDLTLAHYLSSARLSQLVQSVGFKIDKCEEVVRKIYNRKEKKLMTRRWLQGSFVKGG